MLQHEMVQPSTSWQATSIVVIKKEDGTRYFRMDYQKLNDVIRKDAYLQP